MLATVLRYDLQIVQLTPVLQAIVKSKTQMSKARHIIHRSGEQGVLTVWPIMF